MMKKSGTRKLFRKTIAIFTVLMMLLQMDLFPVTIGTAMDKGDRLPNPVVEYLGVPIYEGMNIPEKALLYLCYTFKTSGDAFTSQLIPPKPLMTLMEDSVDVTVKDDAGNETGGGKVVADGGVITFIFDIPLQEDDDGVEKVVQKDGATELPESSAPVDKEGDVEKSELDDEGEGLGDAETGEANHGGVDGGIEDDSEESDETDDDDLAE